MVLLTPYIKVGKGVKRKGPFGRNGRKKAGCTCNLQSTKHLPCPVKKGIFSAWVKGWALLFRELNGAASFYLLLSKTWLEAVLLECLVSTVLGCWMQGQAVEEIKRSGVRGWKCAAVRNSQNPVHKIPGNYVGPPDKTAGSDWRQTWWWICPPLTKTLRKFANSNALTLVQ